MQQNILLHSGMITRVRPRFFDQVGHETINASSGNKHFFTKSCHHQTYQNYEQPPRTSQNADFQSHFLNVKNWPNLSKKKFCKEYWTRSPTFVKTLFSKGEGAFVLCEWIWNGNLQFLPKWLSESLKLKEISCWIIWNVQNGF